MVHFKFYDKKLKKFVPQGPENVWEIRYSLQLWSNQIPEKSVRVMAKLTKQNKKFDLYIKVGSRYEIYTPKIGAELINTKKLKEDEKKVLVNIKKEKEWRKKRLQKVAEVNKKKKEREAKKLDAKKKK
jgi:hypothetical protein